MADESVIPDITSAHLNRRNMIMGAALCGVSALAYARLPRPNVQPLRPGVLDAMIPERIGDWVFETTSGLVVPPADALSDRLYDEVMTRVYVGRDVPPIMFLIAYSSTQTGLLQVHRPEVCYPVGGYRLSATTIAPLALDNRQSLPVRTFAAESPTRTEQGLYWTRVGDALPTNWALQRMAVVEANLQGIIPDGILVRASAIMPDARDAAPYLNRFIRDLAGSLDARGLKLLFGIS